MTRESSFTTGLGLSTAVVGILGGMLGCGEQANGAARAVEPEVRQAVNVVVEPARTIEFRRVINVQGNVEAKRLALVSPRIAGPLDEIFVEDGDVVEAGDTRLFQTDSVKLVKAVEVRRQEVLVAESSLAEKQASLERSQVDYDKAEYDWVRYQDMYEREVVSNDELEEISTVFKRCTATMKHSQALVALAEAQLNQARSSLDMAQKDLDDSLVRAPINGRVARRFMEPGEMGDTGQPVLRIEDPSLIEVSVFLPARVYGEVIPDQTMMQVEVNGVDLGERPVSYKSPTIDPQLRNFEARCLIQEPPAAVAPGAMAHVSIILERREGLGVPRDAIQRRAGGSAVFVADGDVARLVSVEAGLETDGLVEVTSDELDAGVPVVAVGGYFLNPDAPIKVRKEGR